MRRILFVHQNFPGQFVHLARMLSRSPDWTVAAIGGATAKTMQGIRLERHEPDAVPGLLADAAGARYGLDSRCGEAAARAAARLRADGFVPDVIVGHTGWGEMLLMRDVFPSARIVSYLEFFFTAEGGDVNFDPEFPALEGDPVALQAALMARNAAVVLSAERSDVLVSPTAWQASRFPLPLRDRIRIVHEGVDTERLAPHDGVKIELPNGRTVQSGDEVLTYVARNLEPYRGFHRFMRALPAILERRPEAQVLIVGGDEVSYGLPPKARATWREALLDEVGSRLPAGRVHFLGKLPYDAYIGVLQVARVHVYLTYPFVLSWSLLEAMSCGVAIVGSDTAPLREVVSDGLTGRLVGFFDEPALVEATSAALADPASSHAFGAAARLHVKDRFTVEQSIAAYRDIIGGA
ncbi:glycosyltransferase [Alsobacter sp. R-9]